MAMNQLISDIQAGQPFTPTFKDLFKSFDLCQLKDVKVIFVNSHPYSEKGIANGLAFGGALSPFTKEIDDFYPLPNFDDDKLSLEYLPKNGVMLLNRALTCPIGKDTDHIPMWTPIFDELFKDIAYKTSKTIFVFIGNDVEYLSKHVRKGQYKLFIPEIPSEGQWDSIDILNRINEILKKIEKEPIDW